MDLFTCVKNALGHSCFRVANSENTLHTVKWDRQQEWSYSTLYVGTHYCDLLFISMSHNQIQLAGVVFNFLLFSHESSFGNCRIQIYARPRKHMQIYMWATIENAQAKNLRCHIHTCSNNKKPSLQTKTKTSGKNIQAGICVEMVLPKWNEFNFGIFQHRTCSLMQMLGMQIFHHDRGFNCW